MWFSYLILVSSFYSQKFGTLFIFGCNKVYQSPFNKKENIKMNNHQFVKENQRINNLPINLSANNISEHYQEIFNFFIKNLRERFPKKLMD